MAEVLAPQRLDISAEYRRGFEGMVDQRVSLDDLLKTREELINEIVGSMPEQHKKFLVSVKKGEPDWPLFDLPDAKDLPAVGNSKILQSSEPTSARNLSNASTKHSE